MIATRCVDASRSRIPVSSRSRDGPAALVQVEHGPRALAVRAAFGLRPGVGSLVVGQPRASLSYGIPSAAGGMARPTTPASTMMVKM